MKCPACNFDDTKVIDSRVATDGFSIRRRRECLQCSFRFSTYEEMEILNVTVVKRDGRKESYSRDKIISGLKKAFEKRPITNDDFRRIVNQVERDIQLLRKQEVMTQQVGQIVMKHLRKIDQVAYIRYASVYQSFKDAQTFRQEINKLFKMGTPRVGKPRRKAPPKVRKKK